MQPKARSATQLYEATLAARRLHGWSSVAPELERYVDSAHWRSGAPLPDDLYRAAAYRRRFPPWLPSPKQILFTFLLCIIPGIALCGFVAAISTFDEIASSSDDLHSSDAPEAEDRVWVYAIVVLCPFVFVTLLLFPVLRRNFEVWQHVGALYLLYLQDHALEATGRYKDLVLKFRLGRLEYTAYSDGSYEAREIRRYRHAWAGSRMHGSGMHGGSIVHGGTLSGSSLHGGHALSHGSDTFLGSHTADTIV